MSIRVSFIRVSFTTYPLGVPERTVWVRMPFPPAVGDTVHFGGEDIPPMHVTKRSWVYDEDRNKWHLECSAR